MADLSDADVLRILELVDKSSFDYFQLTLGDLRLTVSKEGLPPGAVPTAPVAAPPPIAATAPATAEPPSSTPPAAPPPVAAAAPASPAVATRAAPPAAPTLDAAARAGLVAVPAPMVGTFYRAPEPGAPPFVEVGAAVQEDTTLGLIEAMKVFTSILAGARGVVAEILVENAHFVEYGQPLILIRPEGATGGGSAAG